MSTPTLRLVHVGLGGWGRDWEAAAIPPVSEVDRVACADADPSALETARERLSLDPSQCFSSLAEALDAVPAGAVLVTTSLEAHVPVVREALQAGKHVLVEKPFAPTAAEAAELVDLADERGLVLMVSQNYRYYPAARAAAQLVREKVLGPLGTVRVDFRKWANSAEPGTHRHYRFVHPLLFDMAIHHFDLLRMIVGEEPTRVYTQVTDPPWSNFVNEAAATVLVTFGGGAVASYRGSWVSTGPPTTWTGDWQLECEQGEISWSGRAGGPLGTAADVLRVQLRGQEEAEPAPLDAMPLWGRSAVLGEFARAIASGTEPETSGRRNLGSVALMEAAARSAASGQAEDVHLPR